MGGDERDQLVRSVLAMAIPPLMLQCPGMPWACYGALVMQKKHRRTHYYHELCTVCTPTLLKV